MVLNRALADDQAVGDVLVGRALGQQDEDFALAVGEGFERRALRPQQFAQGARGDLRLDERLAGGHAADGADEVFGRGILEQVAHRPGADGLEDVVVAVEGGQDDDTGVGPGGAEGGGGLDAAQAGHLHVHEHHVGAQVEGQPDTGFAVGCLTDDRHARLQVEQRAQTLAHEGLVFDEEEG